MKTLKTLLKNISDRFERFMNPCGLPAGQEAFLAKATDHCDLEARMRQLERQQRTPLFSQ